MAITFEQALMFLYMAVAVMLIVALYHVIIILVDARKIVRRVEEVTEDLEEIIRKPISVADQVMDYVLELVKQKKHGHKKHDTIDHS